MLWAVRPRLSKYCGPGLRWRKKTRDQKRRREHDVKGIAQVRGNPVITSSNGIDTQSCQWRRRASAFCVREVTYGFMACAVPELSSGYTDKPSIAISLAHRLWVLGTTHNTLAGHSFLVKYNTRVNTTRCSLLLAAINQSKPIALYFCSSVFNFPINFFPLPSCHHRGIEYLDNICNFPLKIGMKKQLGCPIETCQYMFCGCQTPVSELTPVSERYLPSTVGETESHVCKLDSSNFIVGM